MAGLSDYGTSFNLRQAIFNTREKLHGVYSALENSFVSEDDAVDSKTLVIRNLLGMSSHMCSVRYWPVDLIGAITLRFTFAQPSVLLAKVAGQAYGTTTASATPASGELTYSIANMYLTYDCLSMPDSYMTRLRSRLATGDHLPICFNTYVDSQSSSSSTTTHSQQYNLASSSINKVFCVLRDSDYADAPSHPVQFTSDAFSQESVVSKHYAFTSFDSNSQVDGLSYIFKLNSVQHPQYRASVSTALTALGGMTNEHSGTLISSRGAFAKAYGIFGIQLQMPGDHGPSLISGYSIIRQHPCQIEATTAYSE